MKVRFSYGPMLQGPLKCFISYSLTLFTIFFLIFKKITYFWSAPDFGKKYYYMAQYLQIPLFID